MTNLGRPSTAVLARVSDLRAQQFWDKERLLSRAMGERDRNSVVGDHFGVCAPGSVWRTAAPSLPILQASRCGCNRRSAASHPTTYQLGALSSRASVFCLIFRGVQRSYEATRRIENPRKSFAITQRLSVSLPWHRWTLPGRIQPPGIPQFEIDEASLIVTEGRQ